MSGPGGSSSDDRLRRIEAVTDVSLARLDVDDLLDELLERVLTLLNVDTVAVLLVDVHAQQLVATAAKGLEEEVRRGLRIGIGRGFAGRVARDKLPVIIDRVTDGDVVSPTLRARKICSLLGVPMFAGGELVGVLHVGSLTPHRFTPEDVRLLQLAADRVSIASQVRSRGNDRTAALALQRGLLPTRLPTVPGLDMAARYVPGHGAGVGGDWYDVFMLPSRWLGLVIGDVSGHGLRAAVVMGRLRSALRSYALVCDDPADALSQLDRKIHHFEAGNLATVLYAMIAPDRAAVHISLAGHLAPILATPDRSAHLAPVQTDLPLGTSHPDSLRRRAVLEFPPGSVLVCYTDGLVERRGELIDTGIERLRAAVEPASAETVCATIMNALGTEEPTDDIALLTIGRHHDPGQTAPDR